MNFNRSITERIQSVDKLKLNIWVRWSEFLFGSNIEKVEQLSDYQIAFLSILNEVYNDIIQPIILNQVTEEFNSWYEGSDSYDKIMLHSIDISKIETGEWQLTFEDDNIDPIVHLYLNEWNFDYTALTG